MQQAYMDTNETEKLHVVFDEVTKTYGSNPPVVALNNISFSLPQRSFTAITGPSGSGKTTIMNLIGLIDQPTFGHIYLGDKDVSHLTEVERCILRNQHLGFIFQSHFLLPEFSVKENIMMPHWISKEPMTDEVRQWYDDLVQLVDIENIVDKYPDTLSGGQAQRVAVARALINHPYILLADEPASNLDSQLTQELFELFDVLNAERDLTILVITHNQALLRQFPRVIQLKDGMMIVEYQ